MKDLILKYHYIFACCLLLFSGLVFPSGQAAAQEQIVIPLSQPDESGQLSLSMIRGTLNVTGYEGDEVVIRFDGGQAVDPEDEEETRNGLRRISGSGPGFEASENNNHVQINNISPMKRVDFDILVPVDFSLKLSVIHGDGITVENVNGNFEISHVNGEVMLDEVGGAAVVNTVNGDIRAVFNSVLQDKPMAFSNVNGDIDITLPAEAGLSTRMKSEWGEVYTDFDVDIQSGDNIRRDDSDSGIFKVAVNSWIVGEINGGGPEMMIRALHGNIYVRKR